MMANFGPVFPKTQRVIYGRNPLKEVICQFRFPAILKIGEEPVEFQERIRKRFPVFEVKSPFADDVPREVVELWESQSGSAAKTYHFKSEDGIWTVALTREFLAVSTLKYQHWDDFHKQIRVSLEALLAVYEPSFFSRIGLRYKDLVRRSALGLEASDWPDILQPHITAELGTEELRNRVQKKRTELLIDLGDGDRVRIVHGLITEKDSEETCYLVDSDFFSTEKVRTKNARSKLSAFNKQAGDLFRWCIAEKLHKAMEPEVPRRGGGRAN